MSLKEDIAKARAAEARLVKRLNQEESWVSRHPGWVTLIGGLLLFALIVAAVKGCHG